MRLPKTLSGEKVSRGNGLPDVDIYSVWLKLPGSDGPFLELLQYEKMPDRPLPQVNAPGYGHIAFEIQDIDRTIAAILQSGGQKIGEITNFGSTEAPVLLIYMRDPEGNILELEQNN